MQDLSFLLALIHWPPQAANLDFTELHSNLHVTHISHRSEKLLTDSAEVSKSNKQKTRLLERVKRGRAAASQIPTDSLLVGRAAHC